MGMKYSAELNGAVITTARDLFEITAPSDAVVKILCCRIGQTTEEGDAQAEMLSITIARYTGTDGTGGATPTPAPHELGYSAASSTVRTNVTEGATKTIVLNDAFNLQAGWLYQPLPEEMILLSPSGKLAIYLPATPDDSTTFEGTLTFEEIGG